MSSPFHRLFWSPLALAELPPASSGSYAVGAMDWLETSHAHIFKFNAPGYGREDVKVQLDENNVLAVQCDSVDDEHKDDDVVWYVNERKKSGFSRRIQLPDNVKVDHIKASADKGVITVVVPKEIKAKAKPKAIHVTSKL